jgi:hypothetical protein
MISEAVMNRIEALHPAVAPELDNILRLARETVDPELLTLCADYVDTALRRRRWQPPRELSDRESAFIAFTEQFVSSVGTMQDEAVDRLLQHADPDEVYAFVNALYVTDLARRLDMVAGRVLA